MLGIDDRRTTLPPMTSVRVSEEVQNETDTDGHNPPVHDAPLSSRVEVGPPTMQSYVLPLKYSKEGKGELGHYVTPRKPWVVP